MIFTGRPSNYSSTTIDNVSTTLQFGLRTHNEETSEYQSLTVNRRLLKYLTPLLYVQSTLGCSSFPEGAFLLRADGLILAEYLLACLIGNNRRSSVTVSTQQTPIGMQHNIYLALLNSSRKVLIWLIPMEMWQESLRPSRLAMPLKMFEKLFTSWENVMDTLTSSEMAFSPWLC